MRWGNIDSSAQKCHRTGYAPAWSKINEHEDHEPWRMAWTMQDVHFVTFTSPLDEDPGSGTSAAREEQASSSLFRPEQSGQASVI